MSEDHPPADNSRVVFQGPGPFHLATAQRATAIAVEGAVEMTLYAVLDGQGPQPMPVRVGMTCAVALALADDLRRSAVEAELKQARPPR